MALNIYAWLAQRLCRINPRHEQLVAWPLLQDQFGQGFTRLRKFREVFLSALGAVYSRYSDADLDIDERGLTLRHSRPPVDRMLGDK